MLGMHVQLTSDLVHSIWSYDRKGRKDSLALELSQRQMNWMGVKMRLLVNRVQSRDILWLHTFERSTLSILIILYHFGRYVNMQINTIEKTNQLEARKYFELMTREQNLNTLVQRKIFCYGTNGKRDAVGVRWGWVGRWGSTFSEAERKGIEWRTREGGPHLECK